MVLQGEDDAFATGPFAGFLQVADGVVDGLLFGDALWGLPGEDADDGATDGGVVVDPSIYVGMPLIQLGTVGQGEDVADGAAGDVEALKVSTTAKFGKVSHGYDTGVKHDAQMNHKRTPPPPGAPLNGIARSAGGKVTERDWGATHIPEAEMSDTKLADATIATLRQRHDRPFFISCGLFHPHYPWYVPQKYLDLYPLNQIKLPPVKTDDLTDVPPYGQRLVNRSWDEKIQERGLTRQAIQGYLASVSYSDTQIGRVLDALDSSPYSENTIVVLISDHGFHLGEKQQWTKATLWEEATDCVMMFRVPDLTQPNQICRRPVSLLDLYPTLVELAGIDKPTHLDGHSLLPLLQNVRAPRVQPAITVYDGHMAVRTEQSRFIRYWDGTTELYDLKIDPHEWANQTNNPAFQALKNVMSAHLPSRDEIVEPLPSRQAGAVNFQPRPRK